MFGTFLDLGLFFFGIAVGATLTIAYVTRNTGDQEED
jgi:hypothetical protein